MIRFILKRLLIMIPVLIAVVIAIFTIMFFTPGDPAETILGTAATPAQYEAVRNQLGLNDPYFVQLGRYLHNFFLKGDLGVSWVYGTSILAEILIRFPRTATLALVCMAVVIVIGIPLGVTAAVHHNGLWDKICLALTILLTAMPGFWLAMLMILLFAVRLKWLPPMGIGGIKYFIMPVIANSLGGIAAFARQSRSCMLEVINSDYVMMARAKGLSENRVLYRHALPNGMIPLLTMLGGGLAGSLGGSLIIENVFSIPGMGQYLTRAISQQDYPVIRGEVIFLAVFFNLIILLVDICYGFADPRIRAKQTSFVKRGKWKMAKEAGANG